MPPKKAVTTKSTTRVVKRKELPSSGSSDSPDVSPASDRLNKRSKPNSIAASSSIPHPNAQIAEDNGFVLRKFYPPEISAARCAAYNENRLPRPIEQLTKALRETTSARNAIPVQDAVVHWFKSDLRIHDNKALYLASQKTRQTASGTPAALIGLYIISPEDFEAHMTAPVRVDFILRSLAVLRADLAVLDIPLYIETVPKRWDVTARILSLLKEWGARHLFANMEYEVDELRRETQLVRTGAEEHGIAVEVVHDTCVVAPGELCTGTGKQYSVYTPWFRAWTAHLHEHPDLLEPFKAPTKNTSNARTKFASQFDCPAPTDAPENKRLSLEEKTRFAAHWPAGEHEALARLEKFAKERISGYQDSRDFPAEEATSSLSVHLAAGTLSARTAVWRAREQNSTRRLDGGNRGIQTWIGEVAWRDFYRHVLAHWPYVCMNKPFKLSYANISWSYNAAHLTAWCTGRTGYPLVDAAMRQLQHTGWMHNRCRMITASFLAKHLLFDWRLGEQHFMAHLIDGDFASNNGGWAWSAGAGVDPQPWFRIFNPDRQAERFDPLGVYVRRWIPELRHVGLPAADAEKAKGDGKETKVKAGKLDPIHDPYNLGLAAEAEQAGYPRRIVEHKAAREECLRRYKEGLGIDLVGG